MNLLRYWIVTFICTTVLIIPVANAQWFQDFNSGDLSDWSGDVADFTINENDQLQLNASEAGESFIYRDSNINVDSISILLWHNMDFSPSDNNMSRVYLALDNNDPTSANGYFIEIGENGSDDALKFYYLENGIEELIAMGNMGAMASEPATVRIQIDIFSNGLWSISTNYDGDEFTSLEIEFLEDRFAWSQSLYFGIFCKYSASRTDKFFFDDMGIRQFEKDSTPPEVSSLEVRNSTQLAVTFSEPVKADGGVSSSN